MSIFFFFFNDTATTEIYTLSLHDALPICGAFGDGGQLSFTAEVMHFSGQHGAPTLDAIGHIGRDGSLFGGDRKSTRLNSSHSQISYAVFCLKKKNRRTPGPKPSSPWT